jgi:hypothetical protein
MYSYDVKYIFFLHLIQFANIFNANSQEIFCLFFYIFVKIVLNSKQTEARFALNALYNLIAA